MPASLRQPNFAVLLAGAWLVTAAWMWWQFWASTEGPFSDPDDVMRLVQVRGFLAGQSWFDLTQPRLDPPFGYISHWSRLIDAGLAGLFLALRPFTDAAMAERLMRTIWPLLWLLPAMGGVAAIAWRAAGREAALIALALAVFGLPAFQHFKPGRIDHHNVQIALAAVAIACAAWSDRHRWAAAAAGLVSALALAIGLENLPWIVLAGAAIALRFAFDGTTAPALVRYGVALALGAAAMFLVSVAPAHWSASACDEIAINLVAPVIAGGLFLAASGYWFAGAPLRLRAELVVMAACAAAAIFVIIEPRCLGGPFALIDPAARPIWLAQVREMTPLAEFLRDAPVMGAWILAFPAVALIVVALAMRSRLRGDFGFLVAAAALLIALALTMAAVKSYSYAMWFGIPPVAAGAAILFASFAVSRPVRWITAAMLTPVALSAGAITLAQAAIHDSATIAATDKQACFRGENYAALARLPKGLVAADVDFGPMLLAFTPHSVLAAPYHRLSHGIVVTHQAFTLPPDAARKVLLDARVDYLVLCARAKPTGVDAAALKAGLWGKLQAGPVPKWLEIVPQTRGQQLVTYRIKRK